MLIVEVKNGNIEYALKQLKRKVSNTKQNQELRDRKEYTKKSVEKREQHKKAVHKQRKISNLD